MDSIAAPELEALVDRYYEPGDLTRKRQSYLASYARVLSGRRNEALAILELGVSSGASLLCWRDYLPNATIIGIDIAAPPERILGQDRIVVIRGSQDDPLTLDKAAQAAGRPFDLIVDDASHIGYLAKRSMHYLFPRWLAPGGWYVIEDFGTGFLPEYPDGTAFSQPDWTDAQPGTREFHSSQFGMVGVVKQLIDHIMQDVMTGTPSYLAIKRLVVEGNIAFIEKAATPGGAWPGYITHAPRPRAEVESPPTAPLVASPVPPVVQATLANHADRIGELERVIGSLRKILAPALRLRRLMRR
ncbi:MAG: class I SAM-dependent methyltransferase [Proteobacteria bacterium]|nr:class I SAM-dependent methyltransferase [Pseudomonadota bacterium]